MSKIRKETLDRRQFLKGAAATAGAVIAGPSALAKSIANVATPFALHFWNDDAFVDARRMGTSAEKLERVRVTITGVGTGSMQSLEALFFVPTARGSKPHGFMAWVPGSTTSRFEMPVRGRQGISFQLTSSSLGRAVKSAIQLSQTSGNVALREGDYVIVPSGRKLTGMKLGDGEESEKLIRRGEKSAAFQYLVLSIERA